MCLHTGKQLGITTDDSLVFLSQSRTVLLYKLQLNEITQATFKVMNQNTIFYVYEYQTESFYSVIHIFGPGILCWM